MKAYCEKNCNRIVTKINFNSNLRETIQKESFKEFEQQQRRK